MDKLNLLISEIINPHKEFTAIPFWFLNDEFNNEILKNQLKDFKDKGIDGVVLHPRIGIPHDLEYLSDEYFEVIKFLVESAKELDMYIVLYDEAMYPSGSAHGEVVKVNPEFASMGITIIGDTEYERIDKTDAGYKLITCLRDKRRIVSGFSKGTIRGIHFGEDDGEDGAPLSADILNKDSVECFIKLTHERYYRHLKDYFGSTIIGFFTDEPCILGRNTQGFFGWTKGFEDEMISHGGDLNELSGLFDGIENKTTLLYHKLIKKRLNETYYKMLWEWCDNHGIALMGHPNESDDIDEEKYFHIPGQDLIFRRVSPETGGIMAFDSVQAKCSSDAARHMGKRRNSNECFGVCIRDNIPWYMTGGDMKWFIDWLGVRGVNLFIPHAFYYSIRDKRKDERPPDVGPNNIWWKHYKLFSQYMKRISYIMTDSKNAAKIAVLCESGNMPVKETAILYERQIEFNYLPISLLPECRINDNKLCISGYEYEMVYHKDYDDIKLPVKTITDLNEIKNNDFDTETACRNLRVTHITKYGIDMYFVVNEGLDNIESYVHVPIKAAPVKMDLWTGDCYQVEYESHEERIRFLLCLNPYESLLYIMDKSGSYASKAPLECIKYDILKDLCFVMTDNDACKKTYEAIYEADLVTGREMIEFEGEEMAECYCNGSFMGVSFFNKHRFKIGSFIHEGENIIKVIMTGNIANQYANVRIKYGISLENIN